ncbi:alpha/beta fold hydrolase [Leifsonia poae]|uniref:Lysophospholipase n=1 Tax=Leifsonia poae TaxID=110933 RepID=A0A9W6H8W9_9MICO|nr:alpha/beta fold hydrolase [Leifsonia poae]GLJ76085.1 lysophospholipase [Leifsonia poae]
MPTYNDAHGIAITYDVWPVDDPRAIVQVAHGVGEHSGRYRALAEHLNANGYTVYVDDHRGHGRTGMAQWGDASKLGRLGPGGLRATVDALHGFSRLIRDQNPDAPLVFFGHSWGSLMVQLILNKHSDEYDAAVLSGTAYRMLGSMDSGYNLNKRFAHLGTTGAEWLSRDPAVAQAFVDDELTTSTPLPKLFGPVDASRLLGRPARSFARDVPLLIQVGGDDPLGGEPSARRLEQAYRSRSGLTDVTTIVYPGARHEIYNETNRDEVMADLTAWLDARIARRD